MDFCPVEEHNVSLKIVYLKITYTIKEPVFNHKLFKYCKEKCA